MTSPVNIISVFVADFIGILILCVILITNGWKIPTRKKESRILFILTFVTIVNCFIDPFAFYFDGKPGSFSHFGIFIINNILYLYNLIVGLGVVFLISLHLNKKITRMQKAVVGTMLATEIILLAINWFYPIVFSVDENNSYHRESGYIVFLLFGGALTAYSWIIYAVERLKNGSLRYFPVWQFMLPAIICIAVQFSYYGISTQPVGYSVSFAAIVICLQNESLYIDKLTGAFNRYELDKIIETLGKKRDRTIAAIMLDLNDFKSINDNYSHAEGDAALIAVANILSGVVQNDGIVVRFAGDEFIVIINRADENTVAHYKEEIHKSIEEYNSTSQKPYALSVAMGGELVVPGSDPDTDFLKKIDALMYTDKHEYYKSHDRRGRRH